MLSLIYLDDSDMNRRFGLETSMGITGKEKLSYEELAEWVRWKPGAAGGQSFWGKVSLIMKSTQRKTELQLGGEGKMEF